MPWKFEVAAIILLLKKKRVISHRGQFPKSSSNPISTPEVHVTAAPIPPCRSMKSSQNLTEVRSVPTNSLNVLPQPISDSLWMNIILSSCCCCSQTPVTQGLQDDIAIVVSSSHTWPTTSRTVGNVSCDTESSPYMLDSLSNITKVPRYNSFWHACI